MANITIRNVPEDLKRKFYAACVEQGVTMSACLMEHVVVIVNTYEHEKEKDCGCQSTEDTTPTSGQ